MSDENVKVGTSSDNAVLLLAAAEALGLDPSVVATTSSGWFEVPAEVAKKAKVTVIEEDDGKEAPAPKAAAKKTAAKKE